MRALLACFGLVVALVLPARAQLVLPGGGSGGGGGGVSSVDIIAGTNVTVSGTCNSSSSINCTINSSGGAGGSPGGANTDVQFNSSSSFGGDSGFTYAGTGQVTITNSTANTTPLTVTGQSLTGSNAQSMVSLTGTLNTSGAADVIALHATCTSCASVNLLNLYGGAAGNTSEFSVSTNGSVTAANTVTSGNNFITNAGFVRVAPTQGFQLGAANFALTSPSSGSLNLASGAISTNISVPANNQWQFGSLDAASPVAQNITFQNVVGGTSNTAGANTKVIGSLGTGTGPSGNVLFEVGKTGTTGSTQNSAFPLLSLNAGNATGATVQLGDGTNFTTYDSCTALTTGATGIVACTGSAMRFKDILGAISENEAAVGLDKLHAGNWTYKPEYQTQFGGPAEHVSLYADDVEKMDPRCVTYDETGKVHDYYDRCVIAYLIEDRLKMKAEIADLKSRIDGSSRAN